MKAYPKYKPSGISWIGEIPEHWDIRKISRSFKLIGSGTTPDSGNTEYYNEGTINWLLTGDLNDNIISKFQKRITEDAFSKHSALKLYPIGSLVIAMYGATIGKVGLLGQEACVNQACCVLSESDTFSNRYVFYWVLANRPNILNLSYGGGQPNISQEIIRSLRIHCPPMEDQNKIVPFLDKKTSDIDSLIAKKQRLIDLYEEEKATIINQAVTKGVNSDIKLKDSGISWLGKVPDHWRTIKLKYISEIKYGLGQPPALTDDGIPVIRATNVERGKIIEKDLIFAKPSDIPYDRDPILREYDIIVVRSGAYTADSAIVTKQYDGAVIGYDMSVRVTSNNPQFISYGFLSHYILHRQLLLHRIRAAQPHLNREELGETLFLIPPKNEQDEITQYIEVKISEIEQLQISITKQMELLKEYRVSLISEIVTGKIQIY